MTRADAIWSNGFRRRRTRDVWRWLRWYLGGLS